MDYKTVFRCDQYFKWTDLDKAIFGPIEGVHIGVWLCSEECRAPHLRYRDREGSAASRSDPFERTRKVRNG